jgi:hypothetical protein
MLHQKQKNDHLIDETKEKITSLETASVIQPKIFSEQNESSNTINGFLLLNMVAVLWGTQHVVIKSALSTYPTSSSLNFWRFTLSTLLFFPYFLKALVENKEIPYTFYCTYNIY